jgi:hypothetical protein
LSNHVLPKESVYAKIDMSTVNLNTEIDRWNNVKAVNEAHIKNKTEDEEMSMSLIGLAEQNLEYLLSLFHQRLAS